MALSQGTVNVENGSAAVAGVGTDWIGSVDVGDLIRMPNEAFHVVAGVTSDNALTISPAYSGATATDQSYIIVATTNGVRELAVQARQLVQDFQSVRDALGQGRIPASLDLVFEDDLDTGLRRSADNELVLMAGGVEVARVTPTQFATALATITGGTITGLSELAVEGEITLGEAGEPGYQNVLGSSLDLRSFDGTIHKSMIRAYRDGRVELLFNGTVVLTTTATGATTPDGVVYARGNIVGSVGQAAGVPTGAIIERGSNANGQFTKFADGTLQCWHNVTLSATAATTWTYPAAFSETPSVIPAAQAGNSSRFVTIAGPSLSSVDLYGFSDTGARQILGARLIAMGRWF